MPDDFPYRVFLSHSSKDNALVRPLAERLRANGVKVWFDEWVLKPSVPLAHRMGERSGVRAAKIEEGLERSRVLPLPEALLFQANHRGQNDLWIGVGPEQRVAMKKVVRFVIDAEPRCSRIPCPVIDSNEFRPGLPMVDRRRASYLMPASRSDH